MSRDWECPGTATVGPKRTRMEKWRGGQLVDCMIARGYDSSTADNVQTLEHHCTTTRAELAGWSEVPILTVRPLHYHHLSMCIDYGVDSEPLSHKKASRMMILSEYPSTTVGRSFFDPITLIPDPQTSNADARRMLVYCPSMDPFLRGA